MCEPEAAVILRAFVLEHVADVGPIFPQQINLPLI